MLHYKTIEHSAESPWIVMIHGAGGSSAVWYRQISDFRRHFNLLLVDLVGHGGSMAQIVSKEFSFERAAEQVMEVVDHLRIEKAHYMGLSLGSIIVRVIAEEHPERVSKMVLAGAVTQLGWEARTLLKLADWGKHIIPYRILKWCIAKAIIPQRRYGKSMQLFLRNAKKVSFDNFLRWLTLSDNITGRLGRLFAKQLSIPTLYLMGEGDYLFLPPVYMAAQVSADYASVVIVPDAGHVCNVDNNDFFNQASIAWLQEEK